MCTGATIIAWSEDGTFCSHKVYFSHSLLLFTPAAYPTPRPTVTASPAAIAEGATNTFTLSPTVEALDDAEATQVPSIHPTKKVSVPVHAPTQVPVSRSWQEFQTILLTFLVPNPSDNGGSGGGGGRERRQQRQRLRTLLGGTALVDRGELLYVTTAHLQEELMREYFPNATNTNTNKNSTTKNVFDVRLVVTPVSPYSSDPQDSTTPTTSTSNQIVVPNADGSNWTSLLAVSEAVSGKVGIPPSLRTEWLSSSSSSGDGKTLQQRVEQAFEGDAMDRYLDRLQESDDDTLRRVQIAYKGLPSDTPGSSTANTATGSESDVTEPFFEWNTFWIVVVAGAGAGVIALGCVCSAVGYRCCCSGSRQKGKDENGKALELDPTKSSDTQGPNSSDSDDPQHMSKSSEDVAAAGDAKEDGPDGAAKETAFTMGSRPRPINPFDSSFSENESLGLDDDGSSCNQYQPSEITSVYSYIDEANNTLLNDDQSYSVAPSLMYDRLAPDDQSLVSRGMWSVADGLTYNDPNSGAAGGPSKDALSSSRPSASLPPRPPLALYGSGNSRGRILIFPDKGRAGTGAEGGNVPDDDDISMVSDGLAPEPTMLLQRQDTGRSDDDRADAPEAPTQSALLDRPVTDLPTRSPLEVFVAPYSSGGADDDEDDDSASEASYGPTKANKSNLPIRLSKGSLGISVRVRKNKEDLLNNQAIAAAMGESTSDDDSSLFMGPDLGQGGQLLQLSAKDKVDPSRGTDEFRFGPLPRGGRVLTDQEKQHLQLGVNTELNHTGGNHKQPFSMPLTYSTAAEEKKDDEASVSTSGSAPGSGGNYPIDSMASF